MAEQERPLFAALREIPNLRTGLTDLLAERIQAGELKPGQRLPTEQTIMEATGVSRTVVREALATLRAKGLITTRQGLGAFVSATPTFGAFSIVPEDVATVDDLLRVLELRIGIEAEAASLAAERRSQADLQRLRARLDALDQALAAGEGGTAEDLEFHRAMLMATGNDYYPRVFDTFGHILMPRQWARLDIMSPVERKRHVARQKREHEAILGAIEARDPPAARRSLRRHLENATARFMDLRNRLG